MTLWAFQGHWGTRGGLPHGFQPVGGHSGWKMVQGTESFSLMASAQGPSPPYLCRARLFPAFTQPTAYSSLFKLSLVGLWARVTLSVYLAGPFSWNRISKRLQTKCPQGQAGVASEGRGPGLARTEENRTGPFYSQLCLNAPVGPSRPDLFLFFSQAKPESWIDVKSPN